MIVIKDIPISSVVVENDQILRTLDYRILPLVEHLRSGRRTEHIWVIKIDDTHYKLTDGYHRYVAHKLLEKEFIEARFGVV